MPAPPGEPAGAAPGGAITSVQQKCAASAASAAASSAPELSPPSAGDRRTCVENVRAYVMEALTTLRGTRRDATRKHVSQSRDDHST